MRDLAQRTLLEDEPGGQEEDEVLLDTFAPAPILDGSAVIRHDGYDVREWQEALASYGKLAQLTGTAQQQLVTGHALLRDLFWSFHKRAPVIDPLTPLTPAHQVNAQIIEQTMGTVEWKYVREAGTPSDLLAAALATVGVAQRALAALDSATIAHVNRLHELESGAAALFDQAEALEELAYQAQGDRAEALFAQSREARQQAVATQQAADMEAETLAADAEGREDAVRRAARQALNEVEAQIDTVNIAVNTYAGGYSPGPHGHQPLTTKEKIALAAKVGRSRRLKEVAALCGRFTRIALQVQRTKVKHPPDEITSITTGSDLAHRSQVKETASVSNPAHPDRKGAVWPSRRALSLVLAASLEPKAPQVGPLHDAKTRAHSGGWGNWSAHDTNFKVQRPFSA
jgi:hypothetical protein